MKILKYIFLTLLGVVSLILIIALFMRKEYEIKTEITIHAPKEKVFEYIKQLKNQDQFNKWVMMDPSMKKVFAGTDGTVGFIYAWNGNKDAGEGEQEITAVEEGKKVETEIRFIRPMKSVAYANMYVESISENETKVMWSNAGEMMYPMNLMVSLVEDMLGKDMDISLLNLKNNLEK